MSQNIQISKYYEEIRSNCKSHEEALAIYLRKIVIFQSRNKKNSNWNESRLSAVDMTLRQISARTGISLTHVHRIIKKLVKKGILAVYRYKKSAYRNNMIFYHFPDIKKAILKKKAYALTKLQRLKGNTRNIYYINKKKYKLNLWKVFKYQTQNENLHWNFSKNVWEIKKYQKNYHSKAPSISDLYKLLL